MNTREAYDIWSDQYDTNINKTRDLEAIALRDKLSKLSFSACLEIGCGTGKNTAWLMTQTDRVTAIDLSESMLAKAKEKINSGHVEFRQADITGEWNLDRKYDLITFSLMLEHIENLDEIFRKASAILEKDGYIYIGELHPFKQYSGSKARFETGDGLQIVTCFTHSISEFTQTAAKYQFQIVDLDEYFDNNDRSVVPRILTLIFRKTND